MSNKYAGYCADCQSGCGPNHGELKKAAGKWVVKCGGKAKSAPAKSAAPLAKREDGKPARKLSDEQIAELLTREECEWAHRMDGKGLCEAVGYQTDSKDAYEPGDIVTIKTSDGARHSAIVLTVGQSYYMSRRDCEDAEDMDDFGREPGWVTPYTARRVTEPVSARATRLDRERKAAEAAAIETARQADWDAAKAQIPTDYMRRHAGLTCDVIAADWTPRWETVAIHDSGSELHGRRMNTDTLQRADADGTPIYRMVSSYGFGDDLRETYYLPADMWTAMVEQEIAAREITAESAAQWLAQYRGCVGTELYEYAAGHAAHAVPESTQA